MVPRLAPAAPQLGRPLSRSGVFILIVLACALAPVYAKHLAHTGPNTVHAGEKVIVSGKPTEVIGGGSHYDPKTNDFVVRPPVYLGPTWWHAHGRFVLGTDNLGRDVAVRLLYGGRNSLKIGIGSALICTFVAVLLALLAGYNRGWPDWVVTRFFDLIWAFPVFLLAIALSSALASTASTTSASRSSRAASGSRRW